MHTKTFPLLSTMVTAGLLLPLTVMAQEATSIAPPPPEAPAETTVQAPAEEEVGGGVGLNVDVGVASAYVWRGLNLWEPTENDKQHLTLFPSATMAIDSLWFGYWGAYQLSGENKGANVDIGVGAEQDLFLGYDFALTDELGLSIFATYYLYPFADEEVTGVSTPMFLEPSASVGYSTVVDLGLSASWYKGLQDETDAISHLYIKPSVSKEVELAPDLSLGVGAGFGYKIWTGDYDSENGNNWDVQGDVGVTYAMDALYFAPAVHVAFTDVPDAVESSSDGLSYWASLNVGYDFAF